MKIKIYHVQISSVRENDNFSRKCEFWGFLVIDVVIIADLPDRVIWKSSSNCYINNF